MLFELWIFFSNNWKHFFFLFLKIELTESLLVGAWKPIRLESMGSSNSISLNSIYFLSLPWPSISDNLSLKLFNNVTANTIISVYPDGEYTVRFDDEDSR